MAKKKQPKKSLLGSLKNIIGGPPSDAQYAKNFAKSRKRSKPNASRRDLLAPFQLPMLDLDPLVHPTKNNSPRIPPKLNLGTLLVSQRHGIKCMLLEPIEEVEISHLKNICLRKLRPDRAVFLPKVHPYVDEGEEEEEEMPSEVLEENEEDLEDLPFDTSTRA